mgnify:CR=1 FL=1
MKRNAIILAALLVLVPATVKAQFNETNNLFYFAQRAPQSNQLNPAFFPSTLYLQLPALNSLQLGLPLSISDIAKYDSVQGANIIDVNHILDVLGETGNDSRFRMGFDLNVVGLGLKIAGVFVDANMQLKTSLGFTLPFNAISTVLQGNVGDDGRAIPEMTLLDGDLLDLQMYLETSVGAGFHVPLTGLTVGAHVKLLSGLLNINTQNTRVSFNTEDGYDAVSAKIYYEVMGASIVPVNTSDTAGFSLSDITGNLMDQIKDMGLSLIDINGGNNGVAFDIGAKYDIGPLTVSASINDLSAGIHWHNNVFHMVPKGGQSTIEFDGMDITNLLDGGNINVDSLTNYLEGQIDGMIPTVLTDTGDFWYSVPTKLNLGATANLGILKAGILFHGQWDRGLLSKNTYSSFSEAYNDVLGNYNEVKNTFRSNTTLSVGVNLFNWVEVIAGSSFVYEKGQKITMDNFLNPGLGIIVTPATLFQAYFMMDYASSMYLTQMKAFNFKFGFNIIMGGNSKTRIL